jgi:hypothetical protein
MRAALLLLCLAASAAGLSACKRGGAADGAAPAGVATGTGSEAHSATDAARPPGAATADGARAPAPGDEAAPPPDLGELRVVSVMLGESLDADRVVRVARSDFGPHATIHASVITTGMHPGLVLAARWLAPDGSTILETTQQLAPTRPTATTFTLHDGAAPWPAGDYLLDVLANGRRVQRVPFTVH